MALAAAVAVSLGFLIEERVRGVVGLSRWQAAMRARGEKLAIADIVTPAPTNPACLILTPQEVATRLGSFSAPSVFIPAMWYVAPGRAQVGWRADSWMSGRANANNWVNARPADGYVLLTFAGGRDLVWPQPTTAAEIADFKPALW